MMNAVDNLNFYIELKYEAMRFVTMSRMIHDQATAYRFLAPQRAFRLA